ncbi:hypothetical protein D9M71_780190 [compost metagenome]
MPSSVRLAVAPLALDEELARWQGRAELPVCLGWSSLVIVLRPAYAGRGFFVRVYAFLVWKGCVFSVLLSCVVLIFEVVFAELCICLGFFIFFVLSSCCEFCRLLVVA